MTATTATTAATGQRQRPQPRRGRCRWNRGIVDVAATPPAAEARSRAWVEQRPRTALSPADSVSAGRTDSPRRRHASEGLPVPAPDASVCGLTLVAWRMAGLAPPELWWRYIGLGGNRAPDALADYLGGTAK